MAELFSDEYYMKVALQEAERAFELGEVPVGAVVVSGNEIIAKAHNFTEKLNDPTAHAEMQVITAATEWLGGKYLTGCTVYITLEPCTMCAGALFWSQPARVVYGASDPKRGYTITGKKVMHPATEIVPGILGEECSTLLKRFFAERR